MSNEIAGRVLLVDDDAVFVRVLSRALAARGTPAPLDPDAALAELAELLGGR